MKRRKEQKKKLLKILTTSRETAITWLRSVVDLGRLKAFVSLPTDAQNCIIELFVAQLYNVT